MTHLTSLKTSPAAPPINVRPVIQILDLLTILMQHQNCRGSNICITGLTFIRVLLSYEILDVWGVLDLAPYQHWSKICSFSYAKLRGDIGKVFWGFPPILTIKISSWWQTAIAYVISTKTFASQGRVVCCMLRIPDPHFIGAPVGVLGADYNRICPIFARRIILGYLVKNNLRLFYWQ